MLFDLHHPDTGPFPSDIFTVADCRHNTGRRVNLPYPDCAVHVSDCEDVDVINTLDGFGGKQFKNGTARPGEFLAGPQPGARGFQRGGRVEHRLEAAHDSQPNRLYDCRSRCPSFRSSQVRWEHLPAESMSLPIIKSTRVNTSMLSEPSPDSASAKLQQHPFHRVLALGHKTPTGWPVVIVGHGSVSGRHGPLWAAASSSLPMALPASASMAWGLGLGPRVY